MEEDVVAIARLRGESLKELNIPKCCIVEEESFDSGRTSQGLVNMVSDIL